MIVYKIFLMSLFCLGVYKMTHDEMIFDFIRKWFLKKLNGIKDDGRVLFPEKTFWVCEIYKPLFGCIYCMASVWGSVAYISLSFIIGYNLNAVEWLFCCICCVPLNGYLFLLLDNADKKI